MSNKDVSGIAFERAISHSKRVTFFKRLLPVLAFGALTIGGAATYAISRVPDVSVDLPNSTISDGKLVMANPKMDGFTSDRKPYRVTANRAIQDLTGGSEIELETLRADVELSDGNKARLVSNTGTFDSTTNVLVLPQQAILTMSDGMKAIMGSADINIQSGDVAAANSVSVSNEDTKITAEKMRVLDSGKQIIFETNVRVILTPKADDAASTAVVAD